MAPRFNATSHLISVGDLFFNYSDAVPFFAFVGSNALSVTISLNVGMNFNIDPTFGNSTGSSGFTSFVNIQYGSAFTFLGGSGQQITNMSVYLYTVHIGGTDANISMGIYTVTNSSYLVSVANTSYGYFHVNNTAAGWATLSLPTPYTPTNNTVYVLAVASNISSGTNYIEVGEYGGVGTRYTNTSTIPLLSPWIKPSTGSTTINIYCTYSTISSGNIYNVTATESLSLSLTSIKIASFIRVSTLSENESLNASRLLSLTRTSSLAVNESLDGSRSLNAVRIAEIGSTLSIDAQRSHEIVVIAAIAESLAIEGSSFFGSTAAAIESFFALPSVMISGTAFEINASLYAPPGQQIDNATITLSNGLVIQWIRSANSFTLLNSTSWMLVSNSTSLFSDVNGTGTTTYLSFKIQTGADHPTGKVNGTITGMASGSSALADAIPLYTMTPITQLASISGTPESVFIGMFFAAIAITAIMFYPKWPSQPIHLILGIFNIFLWLAIIYSSGEIYADFNSAAQSYNTFHILWITLLADLMFFFGIAIYAVRWVYYIAGVYKTKETKRLAKMGFGDEGED
jgi:hypothetical protein